MLAKLFLVMGLCLFVSFDAGIASSQISSTAPTQEQMESASCCGYCSAVVCCPLSMACTAFCETLCCPCIMTMLGMAGSETKDGEELGLGEGLAKYTNCPCRSAIVGGTAIATAVCGVPVLGCMLCEAACGFRCLRRGFKKAIAEVSASMTGLPKDPHSVVPAQG